MNREDILSDELTRPQPPGIRISSVGVLKLARKLGLALATADLTRQLTAEERERENLALAWLLDERHSLGAIQTAAEQGPSFLSSPELASYEFTLEPHLLVRAQQEIARTLAALNAGRFEIAQKPLPAGATPPPVPPGNS